MDSKKNIPVQVKNRVAWTGWDGYIICGNGDYTITFTFDEEWGEDTAKTAIFKYRTDEGMKHTKQPFVGNTVVVPELRNIREVEVGVRFGDIATTTGATIRCAPSVLCDSGEQSEYEKERFDELIKLFNDKLHGHENLKTLAQFYCKMLEEQNDDGLTILPDVVGIDRLTFGGNYLRYCSDGGVVQSVEEVEREGTKFLRLRFDMGPLATNFNVPEFIDIPVSLVTERVEESIGPGLATNSTGLELDLGVGSADEGGSRHEHENIDALDYLGILDEGEGYSEMPMFDGRPIWTSDHGGVISYLSYSESKKTLTIHYRRYPIFDDDKFPVEEYVIPLGGGSAEVNNITPEQTTFFEFFPANNLLDMSTKQIGLLNNNGNIHTGGSYDTYRYFEQYIPVDEGDEISVQYTRDGVRYTTANGDYNIARVAAYDSDKQILKTLGAVTNSSNKVSVYKVPATVKFIRLSLSQTIDQCTDIAVVKNTNDVVPYEEYNTSTAYLKEQYLKTKKKDIVAFLPDEISCAVGRTVEIYNKQVCPLAEKYHFRWVCNVGKALERKFSITGTEALIGDYSLTLEIYDDEETCLYSKASTLKIVSNVLTDNITICPIGDSLTNTKQWLNEVPTLSENKISYVGTRGGGKHEGRSGFTSTGYLTAHSYDFEQNNVETVHPFWDSTNSKFSWEYYKTNSGVNPSAVQIFLGTNDLFGNTTPETFSENIKTMVDDIRSNDTNIPIFVVMTILVGSQNGLGKQQSTDGFAAYKGKYKYNLDCKFIKAMKLLHDTLKGYDNLYFVPLTECHDNEYNFGAVETPVNPRATQTEYMPNEGIHPQQQGYEQMADVMYSVYCRAFIS